MRRWPGQWAQWAQWGCRSARRVTSTRPKLVGGRPSQSEPRLRYGPATLGPMGERFRGVVFAVAVLTTVLGPARPTLAATAATATAAPSAWRVVDIGRLPAGQYSSTVASDINDYGQVVG